ncbi:N-acetyltransferase domain-containing protein [Mycena chlorophos]|uniref:N-acetyltransferase domain-containing protein n=1 Tax=Mycena chlorophos TaxID=658473 RepID=A0A8H6SBP4_MYCCL|nr:N-acetyltransferase domain-containing protein [Mycena chlorophos]
MQTGFDLGALTDLVSSQTGDRNDDKNGRGGERPAYALLTVLNMHANKIIPRSPRWPPFLRKKQPDSAFSAQLRDLFAGATHVGLVLCERLVNMPVQTIPPMYRLMSEELKSALAEARSKPVCHQAAVRIADVPPSRRRKEALANRAPSHKSKSRKSKAAAGCAQARPIDGIYSFHPEDATIQEYALHSITYPFSTAQEPRDADSFGLDVRGRLMLVEAGRWEALVARMSEIYV